jgi:hypothetical protein
MTHIQARASKRAARTHKRAAIVRLVCSKIAHGALVADACKDVGIRRSTLYAVCQNDTQYLAAYERARVSQAHAMAEDAVQIADGLETGAGARLAAMVDSLAGVEDKDKQRLLDSLQVAAVQRDRLRVDTRKWLTTKIAPRLYGDHSTQEVTGTVTVEHVDVTAIKAELAARLAGIASRQIAATATVIEEDPDSSSDSEAGS